MRWGVASHLNFWVHWRISAALYLEKIRSWKINDLWVCSFKKNFNNDLCLFFRKVSPHLRLARGFFTQNEVQNYFSTESSQNAKASHIRLISSLHASFDPNNCFPNICFLVSGGSFSTWLRLKSLKMNENSLFLATTFSQRRFQGFTGKALFENYNSICLPLLSKYLTPFRQ